MHKASLKSLRDLKTMSEQLRKQAALEAERLAMSLRMNVLTPWVKANGMGDVDPARFARSVKDVAEAFNLPAAPEPGKVFTSRFLPPKAERMIAP